MDKLSDQQLEVFDAELVNDRLWLVIKQCIDRDFPSGQFSFVDLGGGNGVFADRVLAEYEGCSGSVIDASELLISRNTPSPRKKVVCADALDLKAHCADVDIVFCNWLLHHLVTTGSRNQTLLNIESALGLVRQVLSKQGRLSIYENDYEGFVESFPSRAIFALTSSARLAPFVRSLGANTAGVGVCFQSKTGWTRSLRRAGFGDISHTRERTWKPALHHRALLIREAGFGHYWAST